jgi:glutathione S-transferase
MLAHANADWEDCSFGMDSWPALKSSMPGGQVPCLELSDGTKLGESHAILRYLGAKLGYYPTDPMLAFQSDQILEASKDIKMDFVFTKDPSEQAEKCDFLFNKALPTFLDSIE